VSSQPFLVGPLADELGPYWTLDKTEELLNEMLREGLIREANEDERRSLGSVLAYVSLTRPSPSDT
jgi:hypothetical protein